MRSCTSSHTARIAVGSVDRHGVLEMLPELSHGDRLGVRSLQAGAVPSSPRRAQLWNQEASGFRFWLHNFSVVSMSRGK